MMINEIINNEMNEIIKEAYNGYVHSKIGGLHTKFETKIESVFSNVTGESNVPILNIQNYSEFLNSLYQYIYYILTHDSVWEREVTRSDLNDFIKKHLVYLLANATYDDFAHPAALARRYLSFLNDETFQNLNEMDPIYLNTLNAFLTIQRVEQPCGQETPYALDIALNRVIDGENYQYHLPYVRYGVTTEQGEKRMYLYAIQNKPSNNLNEHPHQLSFNKEINRKLYKLNKGVTEEDILNISPSFLLVETILVSLMQNEQIQNLYIAEKLPQKIYVKDKLYGDNEKYRHMTKRKIQALGIITDVESLKHNLTDRFLNVSKRLCFHMSGVKLDEYIPGSFLKAHIDFEHNMINNEILEEVYKSCANLRVKTK